MLTLHGTIHGQHVGYPMFNAVRIHAMRSFTSGYRGDKPLTEASPDEGHP